MILDTLYLRYMCLIQAPAYLVHITQLLYDTPQCAPSWGKSNAKPRPAAVYIVKKICSFEKGAKTSMVIYQTTLSLEKFKAIFIVKI